jgi:hypothetical protein
MTAVAFTSSWSTDLLELTGFETLDSLMRILAISINIHGDTCGLQRLKGMWTKVPTDGCLSMLVSYELGSPDTSSA